MASAVNSAVVDLNSLIVFSILPFNLFKGVVISIITFLVYKRVSPILHK
jgi:riboflavin transporter FmnP